jgi:hypothetical protein
MGSQHRSKSNAEQEREKKKGGGKFVQSPNKERKKKIVKRSRWFTLSLSFFASISS